MAITDPIRQKPLHEKEIDHLLAEEFSCDPNFLKSFAAACGLKKCKTLEVLKVVPEPSLGGNGNGDLLVQAKIDGQSIAFLIEDKITAGPQPGQAKRYADYAKCLVQEGWDCVITALVAPSKYVGEQNQYDVKVNLEDVAEMLNSPDPLRRKYRREIIARAIEKKASKGVQNPDSAVYQLRADYLDWFKELGCENGHRYKFPLLKEEYHGEDCWFEEIRHPNFPNYVFLRHRLWTSIKDATGSVDLIVSPASADDREQLEAAAPEESTVAPFPIRGEQQGIQFSVRVPELHKSTGFCETSAAEAHAAMVLLTRFFSTVKRKVAACE